MALGGGDAIGKRVEKTSQSSGPERENQAHQSDRRGSGGCRADEARPGKRLLSKETTLILTFLRSHQRDFYYGIFNKRTHAPAHICGMPVIPATHTLVRSPSLTPA